MGIPSRIWRRVVRLVGRASVRVVDVAKPHEPGVTSAPCGEETELPSADHYLRRFRDSENHLTWDYDKGSWIPAPGSLNFNPDLSGSWREHLTKHGLWPESIARDGYTLVGQWLIGDARDLNFLVDHTPQGREPIDCAHTSLYWPPDSIKSGKVEPEPSKRKRLRSDLVGHMSWVHGEIRTPPPDDWE